MAKLLAIRLIELLVNLYDLITLPLYYLIQQPWKFEQLATRVKARQVEPNVWENIERSLDNSNRRPIDTLDELFRDSVANYAPRNCLGERKILAVEYKDSSANGLANGRAKQQAGELGAWREPSRFVLDDKYTWLTYAQIEQLVARLAAGLHELCAGSLEADAADGWRKLLICADTCMQWFLVAHACFRTNVTVVTAYTTLDDEAILHSIHQTEVRVLVVSQKFSVRLARLLSQAPLVDTVIVLDEPLPGSLDARARLKPLLGEGQLRRVLSYEQLLESGALSEARDSKRSALRSSSSGSRASERRAPSGDDIAVLMYTSGSTGKAKGVMLTHKSIVYTALAFSGPGNITHLDRYIGYLPLGHVLELAAECIFLRNGSTIAYSSPLTLTDSSPMVGRGQRGDAFIFKPTIMGAVPLVLDRVRQAVQRAVAQRGPFFEQLINEFVLNYKRYWCERYYETPLMNWLVCNRFNSIMGGHLRAICSGGAALSRDTQEYLRYVANFTVLQGYGLTETSAAASFGDLYDRRCCVVGPPYPIVRIKLESWSDYSTDDKPHPRGEIIVGGQPVSAGYYKMDELTRESFYEHDGWRYFRTGDIGLMLPDGSLKIIDRKKDLVKPLSGEYISLSEIENALGTARVVENICVYCSQFSNYIIALIRPQMANVRHEASQLMLENSQLGDKFRQLIKQQAAHNSRTSKDDILNELTDETLCSNQWLVERLLRIIQHEGERKGLKRTQIPSKIKLCLEEWSPEARLVTASFKLKRRELERFYANDIKQLYATLGQNIDQNS